MTGRPSSRRSDRHHPESGVMAQEKHTENGNGASSLPAPASYGEYKSKKEQEQSRSVFRIKSGGESGRKGIDPLHFFRIIFRSTSRASMVCNILWPFVPAALAVRYALPHQNITIFALAYIAMVPCANLIGFAGQEFARKVPHVWGVLIETTCGSAVEIVLFMILIAQDQIPVIKAAILGSILATMLLCLGFCFFVGGMHREEQTFSDAISETGSGLLLTAGVVLAVPSAFEHGLKSVTNSANLAQADFDTITLKISRIIAILLIISYFVFVWFQARSHHGIYDAIFEYDEHRDEDKHKDMAKAKLTMTECIVALVIAIALVSIIAYTLVTEIEPVIERGNVTDAFMGLILVPLVEKFAEHLTAIDEAWDNQMNFALSHVLGATIQTALFNGPLAVIVGWGLKRNMDLNFELFNIVMLLLAIITVGRFLQDQKSNYLEGALLIILYVAIAVSAWYYPNTESAKAGESGSTEEAGHEALRLMTRALL